MLKNKKKNIDFKIATRYLAIMSYNYVNEITLFVL